MLLRLCQFTDRSPKATSAFDAVLAAELCKWLLREPALGALEVVVAEVERGPGVLVGESLAYEDFEETFVDLLGQTPFLGRCRRRARRRWVVS